MNMKQLSLASTLPLIQMMSVSWLPVTCLLRSRLSAVGIVTTKETTVTSICVHVIVAFTYVAIASPHCQVVSMELCSLMHSKFTSLIARTSALVVWIA